VPAAAGHEKTRRGFPAGRKKPIPGKPGIGAQFLSVYFPMQGRIDSIK